MTNLPEKLFLIWSRSSGRYSKLCAILTERGWTVSVVQNATSLVHVTGGRNCCLAILDPKSNFTPNELNQITDFLSHGNSALVAISANEQDDDTKLATNINELTRPLYGVEFQMDCVVRPNPYELYHPKEAMLEDFIANRELTEMLKRHTGHKPSEENLARPHSGPTQFGPRIIYAQGCTLRVVDGAVDKKSKNTTTIMMTSTRWALPSEQPTCTFHRSSNLNKAILLGSCHMLNDNYLDKEDNRSLVSCLLDFLNSTPARSFPINI